MIRISRERRTVFLVVANIAALLLYMFIASATWVEPELADVAGASGGDAVIWVLGALPILLFLSVVNIAGLIWSTIVRYRNGQWHFVWGAWSVPAIWGLAVAYDFSRHGG